MIILLIKHKARFGIGTWLAISLIIESTIATLAATALYGPNPFKTRINLES